MGGHDSVRAWGAVEVVEERAGEAEVPSEAEAASESGAPSDSDERFDSARQRLRSTVAPPEEDHGEAP